jgi:hypothetical protein
MPSSVTPSSTASFVAVRLTMIVLRARVADGVADGLLRHTEQAKRHIRVQIVEVVHYAEHHFDVMMLLDFGAVTPQCLDQAGVLQHTGVQFM